jgi:hypothetical protein
VMIVCAVSGVSVVCKGFVCVPCLTCRSAIGVRVLCVLCRVCPSSVTRVRVWCVPCLACPLSMIGARVLWVLCPCVGCVRRVCGKGSCVPCMAYWSATRLVCAVCGVERVGLSSELVFGLRCVGVRVLCLACWSAIRVRVWCAVSDVSVYDEGLRALCAMSGVLVRDEDGGVPVSDCGASACTTVFDRRLSTFALR